MCTEQTEPLYQEPDRPRWTWDIWLLPSLPMKAQCYKRGHAPVHCHPKRTPHSREMQPWDDAGKCQASTLQLLNSVLFRSSKSPSRVENILCFQITLLLLGSQQNSIVFCFNPKSASIRDPVEVLALSCSAHPRQQTPRDAQIYQPPVGKP